MGVRVVRGVPAWFLLLGLELLMVGSILTGAFLMFRQPSVETKMDELDGALDYVTYAVPEWLWQVGLPVAAAGLVVAYLAWMASPPWYDGIQMPNRSARAEIVVPVISGALALASGIVAVAVSWRASPVARTFGTIAVVVLGLALVASPAWVPWARRRVSGDA